MKTKAVYLAVVVALVVSVLGPALGLPGIPGGVSPVSAAGSWYVAPSGSDSNDGSQANPWQHIQYAIDTASDGDTIHVLAGTYDGTINIVSRNNLTIVGEDKNTTIIKSSSTIGWGLTYGTARNTVARCEDSTDITFQNLTIDLDLVKGNNVSALFGWNSTGALDNNIIKNSSRPDLDGYYYELGVYLRAPGYTDASRATFSVIGNTFYNAGRVALVTHDYINTTVTGNVFYKDMADFGYAMEIGSQSTGTVSGNTIYGYDTPAASDGSTSGGIYVENCFTSGITTSIVKDVVVEGNEIYGCQMALTVGNEWNGYAGDVDIVLSLNANNFHDNLDEGVIIADEDMESGSSVTVTGGGNALTNNGDYGYYIYTYGDGNITVDLAGDTITGHGTGVMVEEATPSTSSYSIAITGGMISGNSLYGLNNAIAGLTVDATSNWWGTTDPAAIAAMITGVGSVLYDPWLGIPTIVYVDASYTVSSAGGHLFGYDAFTAIQDGVSGVAAGGTVNVAAGTYDVASTIVLNKALTVSGPIGGGAIVRGTDAGVISIFEIAASDVTVENLEITHNALPAMVSPFVELNVALLRVPVNLGVSGIAITNNELYVPAQPGAMSTWNGVGITVGSSTAIDISISENTIHNTRNGVVVQYNNTATISGNIIYDTKGGVMNYTNTQADADNRMVSGNSWGTTHNEWDIVWNTAYYVPDYQQSVLALSGANNDAYVLDRRAADAAACAALTGNRSHIFVDDDSTVVAAHPAKGNFNEPFSTIALGIEAVVPGGTVYVAAGTYAGAVVAKDVALIGEAGGGSIIATGVPYKVGGGLTTAFRLDETADGSEIRNFTVNCDSAGSFYFGVFARGADSVVVDSVTVNDAVQGITNWGGSNWEIANNVVTGTVAASGGGIAIFLGATPPSYRTCSGNYVHDNTIGSTATAPDYSCPGIVLTLDLRYGAYDSLDFTEELTGNLIENNDYTGTGGLYEVGIEVGVIGLEADPAKIAATLGMIHDNTVSGNTVDGADLGMYLYTVTDLQVLDNIVTNSVTAGIALYDGFSGGQFSGNDIYGNAYGFFNDTAVQVDATNNWWGDNSGPYHVTLNPSGLGNEVSDYVSFVPWTGMVVGPPAAPALVSPANGSTVTGTSVIFEWSAVAGAVDYKLLVSTSSDIFNTAGYKFNQKVGNVTTATVDLQGGTKYYWWVFAYASDGSYSPFSEVKVNGWWFTTPSTTIAAPTLVSPANGATVAGTSVVFEWSSVAGAVDYKVLVSTSSNIFNTGGYVFNQQVGNVLTYPVTLQGGKTYYWWVFAYASDGSYSPFSEVKVNGWWFTTPSTTIAAPMLVSPANGETVSGTSVVFEWSSVAGAVDYKVLVSTSSNIFNTGGYVFNQQVGNVLTYPVTLQGGKTYYWWVFAYAVDGSYSAFSEVKANGRWFTCTAIGAPTLISPADGETVSATAVVFEWNAVSGADDYKLLVSTSSDIFNTAAYKFNAKVGNVTTATIDLESGKTYYWWVFAYTGDSYSPFYAVKVNGRWFMTSPA